jgi:hypothetical protein
LVDLGADVNKGIKGTNNGITALVAAAQEGNLDVVRCLVGFGASIEVAGSDFETALLVSARKGHHSTMQFLLEHTGANIDYTSRAGRTVWDLLCLYKDHLNNDENNPAALTALLHVMVLRGDPPPTLGNLIPPENALVLQEGAWLRARLPAYLVERQALLNEHCPVLLPPLRTLVHGYMELTTTEELWDTGLGADS